MRRCKIILDKTIRIGLNPKNISHFEKMGYKIPRDSSEWNDKNCRKDNIFIEVRVEDLHIGSYVKVNCECDECKKLYKTQYNVIMNSKSYINDKKTLCMICANKIYNSGENNGGYKHGNKKYSFYKSAAKGRNYEFDLTIDDFNEITKEECHYCGGYNDEIKKENGIDRKNNQVGYLKENCIPCCGRCNEMKMDSGYNEFLLHIIKIHNRMNTITNNLIGE